MKGRSWLRELWADSTARRSARRAGDERAPDGRLIPAPSQPVHYQLYFFDAHGFIEENVVLTCASDDDAVARAMERSDRRPMELWKGAERVRRFNPTR